MTTLQWTERAQADLAAIRAFIEADSPHYASVTVRRILHAVDRFRIFRNRVGSFPNTPIQSSAKLC